MVLAGCDNSNTPGGGDPELAGTITISPSSGVTTGTELTATYSGAVSVTYQWKKDEGNVASGGTGATYTPTEAGSYTVTVSASGYQSKTSAAVAVTGSTLSELLGTITISPSSGVTTGTELTATYSGAVSVTYQWKKDGINVASGGTDEAYTPAEVGSYTVTVSASGYQSKTSAPVTVTLSALTWTEASGAFEDPTSTSSGDSFNGVAYGGGTWVAVGQNGKIATSTDGATWTPADASSVFPDNIAIYGAAYDGSADGWRLAFPAG